MSDLLRSLSEDRALAAEILFSERHPQESPGFHIEMMDLWRSADEFVLIEAFRGGGKTTRAEEFLALAGAYGNFRYWLLIGETYEKACQRLEAINRLCSANQKMLAVFQGQIIKKAVENRLWFSSGTLLQAVGWEQEFQSFKYLDARPDGAYLDDVENKERVRDSSAVDDSMRKLYLELVPALDTTRRRVRFAQARRSEDCMVTRLARSSDWLYRCYPIADRDVDDPEARSLWPQRYPMEWIRNEKRRYQEAGMLSEFMQEYMLQAIDSTTKPFHEDQLAALEVAPWEWLPRYAIYDPARTSNVRRIGTIGKSDRTGKVVVSRFGGRILVHESSGNYWKPNELIEDVFRTAVQHEPVKIAIERTSLNDWLEQPMRLEMLRRGTLLPLSFPQAPQDRSKEEFILSLQPFANAGEVVLVGGKMAHPQLVAEWSNYPAGPRDVLNALAYALRVFGGMLVYEDFSADNIGNVPGGDRGEDIFVAVNATPAELAAVACRRDGRRLWVVKDWLHAGAIADTVKMLSFEVRSHFPQAALQWWAPAEVFDQWQRVPLVPGLRSERFSVYRAEHVAVARGGLADRLRNRWRNNPLLMVDRDARGTLNALAAGYQYPLQRDGTSSQEPEAGPSRLLCEGLECMVVSLDRSEQGAGGMPKGAHTETNPSGVAYISANPRSRLRH